MYPTDQLTEDQEDDGTMPNNIDELAQAVVGHRIVSVERGKVTGEGRWYRDTYHGTVLTLDNGTRVGLVDTDDCCAYTELMSFLLHADKVDHIITGVATTDGFTKWHIYADMGDVLELTVGWSAGNIGHYVYGFEIVVEEVPA